MILRAYKTEITVNDKQQTLLLQNIGCARWSYNWALAKKKEAFDKKEKDRQDKIQENYKKLWPKNKEKSPEWWFDTHGIDVDSIIS